MGKTTPKVKTLWGGMSWWEAHGNLGCPWEPWLPAAVLNELADASSESGAGRKFPIKHAQRSRRC